MAIPFIPPRLEDSPRRHSSVQPSPRTVGREPRTLRPSSPHGIRPAKGASGHSGKVFFIPAARPAVFSGHRSSDTFRKQPGRTVGFALGRGYVQPGNVRNAGAASALTSSNPIHRPRSLLPPRSLHSFLMLGIILTQLAMLGVASASVRRPQKSACHASAVFAGGVTWWPARPIPSGSAGVGSREGLLVIPREPAGGMFPRFLGVALQGVEIVQGVAGAEPAGVD